MRDYKITDIDIVNRKKGEREVVCTLENGTEVHITDCYESWEQWGGTRDELSCTALAISLPKFTTTFLNKVVEKLSVIWL